MDSDRGSGTAFSAVVDGQVGTERLGRALSGRLLEGDAVLLRGGLAAGKTTLVRAIVAGLGSSSPVTSPTFALAQFYDTAAGRVLHIDTYRLHSVAEFRDLALDEFFPSCIMLIEWGDLVADEVADPLVVSLAPGVTPDQRTILVTGAGPRWAAALPGLCQEIGGLRR